SSAETVLSVLELRRGRDSSGQPREWVLRCPVLPSTAAFGPGGDLLAVGYSDGSAQLWDLRSPGGRPGTGDGQAPREVFRWVAHAAAVRTLDFTADGTGVVTSADAADVQVLDLSRLHDRLAPLGLDW